MGIRKFFKTVRVPLDECVMNVPCLTFVINFGSVETGQLIRRAMSIWVGTGRRRQDFRMRGTLRRLPWTVETDATYRRQLLRLSQPLAPILEARAGCKIIIVD